MDSKNHRTLQGSVDEDYIKLQREVLHEQGESWFLNIHGWNDRNQTTPVCEWQGITCDIDDPIVIAIDLVGYNIAGQISPSLGSLTSLMHINLSENYLSGHIPDEVGSLPYLVTFKANHNRLSGQIPHFVSSMLNEVNISHNVLKGMENFSDEKIKLSQLEIFDASYNSMEGNIPEAFGTLTHLHHLDLSFNKLYGSIPLGLGEMEDLKSLLLNDNNLIGTIPRTLTRGELSLVDLNLSNNDLSGTIPTGFSNIRYLKNFQITGNKLTGSVPLPLCHLSLNDNLFEGNDTPDEQGGIRDGCTSIACPMNSASLTGVHPCLECGDQGFDWYVGHVGKCLHLNEKILLDKIYEKTNGPMWKEGTGWTLTQVDKCSYSGIECSTSGHVTAINLTDHGLTGPIPEEFGLFRYLESIDLSDNELTGYLPSDFRFLPLEYLDVSGNKLDGVVPPMLCLAGDINGNGNNNDFNCDIIACPSGTWSPIGRATPAEFHNGRRKREHSCKPCKKTHSFLGSRECGGALLLDSNKNLDSHWIQRNDQKFAAFLTIPLIVACLIVAFASWIILRRKQKFMGEAQDDQTGKKSLMPRRTSLRHAMKESLTRTDSTLSIGSIRNSVHTIGRRFSFYRNDTETSNTFTESARTFGESTRSFGESIAETRKTPKAEWNYDTDCEEDIDEDHDILVKSFGTAGKSSKERSEMLNPLRPSESAESLPANKDRRIHKSSKDEGGDDRSGSQTSSKSKGSKNTRTSKKAEKWLDVPHVV